MSAGGKSREQRERARRTGEAEHPGYVSHGARRRTHAPKHKAPEKAVWLLVHVSVV